MEHSGGAQDGPDRHRTTGRSAVGLQRPRLGWTAVGLALVAGIIAWIAATADTEPSEEASPTPEALPDAATPEGSDEDLASGIAGEPGPAPHAPFELSPSMGLADMAEVDVSVPTPYLTQGRPAMSLCVAGLTFACTDVATSDLVIGATENSVRATLPRRFTTRIGDIHDCVDDSPCELRLWVFDFRIEERNLSLSYADGPAPAGLVVDTQVDGDGRLILDLPGRSHKPLLCLTGLDRACMALRTLPLDSQTAGGLWRVAVEPADLVVTPRGPFSCGEEGPCEIRFVTPDGSFAEPLPVNPSRSQTEETPILAVRPSHGLVHGQQAQIFISNTTDTRSPLWMCALRQRLCVALDVIAAKEPVLLRLPRVLADRHGAAGPAGSAIDCAATACELRAIAGDRLIRQSVTFDAGTGPPPEPELVITDPGPFDDGQLVAVRGRGFFGPVDPAVGRVSPSIRLCETPDAAPAECTVVIDSEGVIAADGTLDAVIRIPPSSAWRQTFDLDGSQRLACEDACWLVVEEALETPSATVPIDIVRSDHPPPSVSTARSEKHDRLPRTACQASLFACSPTAAGQKIRP